MNIKKIAIFVVVLFMILAGIRFIFALYEFVDASLDNKIPEIIIEYNTTRFCQVNCSNEFNWEGDCEELEMPENIDCTIKVNTTIEGQILQSTQR